MAARPASARVAGPTFTVEAGGGRRTRIRNLSIEAGACGSIFAPLLDSTRVKPGFANGNGMAVFGRTARQLHLRLELRVRPRGEGLVGSGVLKARIGSCHERVPFDLVPINIEVGVFAT